MEQLNSQGPSRLCVKCLLDMSARTQICAAHGDRLLTGHLRRLRGGLSLD